MRQNVRNGWLLFSLGGGLLLGACQTSQKAQAQEERRQADQAQLVNSPKAAEPQAPQELSGRATYQEEAFSLRWKQVDKLPVGEWAEVVIELLPLNGYKVNEEYPIKFVFSEQESVSLESPVLKKEQGQVSAKEAQLKGRVQVKAPGQVKLGGTLSFSVCTEERCLIEKRNLVLEVPAS